MVARTDLTGEYECRTCGLVLPGDRFNVKTATRRDGVYKHLALDCKTCGNALKLEQHHQKRLETYAVYGGKCICCGEHRWQFLSLDHIENDGASHRRAMNTTSLFMWAWRNEFPSTLQLMCINCNVGRSRNGGICPHQLEPGWKPGRVESRSAATGRSTNRIEN